jgi:hypothetical protein
MLSAFVTFENKYSNVLLISLNVRLNMISKRLIENTSVQFDTDRERSNLQKMFVLPQVQWKVRPTSTEVNIFDFNFRGIHM